MMPAQAIPQVLEPAVSQEEEPQATLLEVPALASGENAVAEVREESEEWVERADEVTEVKEVAERSSEVGPGSTEVKGGETRYRRELGRGDT